MAHQAMGLVGGGLVEKARDAASEIDLQQDRRPPSLPPHPLLFSHWEPWRDPFEAPSRGVGLGDCKLSPVFVQTPGGSEPETSALGFTYAVALAYHVVLGSGSLYQDQVSSEIRQDLGQNNRSLPKIQVDTVRVGTFLEAVLYWRDYLQQDVYL